MNIPRIQCIFLSYDFGVLGLPYHFRVTACCTDLGRFCICLYLNVECASDFFIMSVFQVTGHEILMVYK